MADWGHKTRFSIAAFRSLDELEAAVTGLLAAGFAADQIGLAASETSVQQLKASQAAANGSEPTSAMTALIARFVPTSQRVAGSLILVSEGTAGQFTGCFVAPDVEGAPSGLKSETRAKLLSQLYSGAWLLGANAHSYEQLRAGTRILLAHSSDRVETFELHGP